MDNKLCKYQLKYLILFAERLSTKNMKQAYWDLDLIRLSAENAAVHLNKEFILIDNFDGTSEQTNTDLEFVNHPVKLSFTIAIFACRDGCHFKSICRILNFGPIIFWSFWRGLLENTGV